MIATVAQAIADLFLTLPNTPCLHRLDKNGAIGHIYRHNRGLGCRHVGEQRVRACAAILVPMIIELAIFQLLYIPEGLARAPGSGPSPPVAGGSATRTIDPDAK